MSEEIPENADSRSTSFRQISDAFLSQDGLPFSEVLTAEKIQNVFSRNDELFGMNGVYSTVIVLWGFLSQVLKDGKEASCQSAVARIVSHCLEIGIEPPTKDTGDYCKARAKLSLKALRPMKHGGGKTATPNWSMASHSRCLRLPRMMLNFRTRGHRKRELACRSPGLSRFCHWQQPS